MFKTTLGGWIWKTNFKPLQKKSHLDSSEQIIAIILTVICIVFSFSVPGTLWLSHSLFKKASLLEIPFFAPTQLPTAGIQPYGSQKEWLTLPFFYAIGSLPTRYPPVPDGKAVLFSIPYQKGPPEQFAGHITARWQLPQVKLLLEGPKTPQWMGASVSAKNLRPCLMETPHLPECLTLKRVTLKRHIDEMEALGPVLKWDLQWFEVPNPHIPLEESPRGIYLKAEREKSIEDRYILITPHGAHQTLILSRFTGEPGFLANELIRKIIGSLRVFSVLEPGRAWVDQRLSEMKLPDMKKIQNPMEVVEHLFAIQTLLISKISVDPKTPLTYYHLGGTALLLSKQAALLKTTKTQLIPQPMLMLAEEWSGASKPMVKAALDYLKDVAPKDPNILKLEDLYKESQNY